MQPGISPSAPPFWARPAGVALIVALYCLAHGLLRWLASPSFGIDDGNEAVFAQSLQWGYQARQPPLYDWILWGAHRVGGVGIGAPLVIKYSALCLAAGAAWAAARRLSPDPRIAAAAAFSFAAMYQVGWNFHEGVTHTALLSAAVLLGLVALMRAAERPGAGRFLALGLMVGIGLLSKHAYAATIAQLSLAALLTPGVRARLADRRLLLVLPVALAMYLPYALWLTGAPETLAGVADGTLRGKERPVLVATLEGLVKPLLFAAPLPLILAAYGRRWLAPARPGLAPLVGPPEAPTPADWLRFLRIAMAAGMVGLALSTLFFGVVTVKERHMHAMFIALPVWAWAELALRGEGPLPLRRAFQAIGALAVVVFALRALAFAMPDESFCGSKCRQAKPYSALGPAIEALDASRATLVAPDRFISGNLRALAPGARVVPLNLHHVPPLDADSAARCLLVRDRDVTPDGDPEAAPSPELPSEEVFVEQPWPHLWKSEGWKASRFAIRELSPADPRCRIAPAR